VQFKQTTSRIRRSVEGISLPTAPQRHLVRCVQAEGPLRRANDQRRWVGIIDGIIDGIVYGAVTGAIFAWRWPR